MFTPKNLKLKHKRAHRAHITQRISKSFIYPSLKAGVVGIKILKFGFLFPKQLQAAYQTLNKLLKKKASIYFFAFPNASLTTKKVGARMGKGKGKVLASWVFKVTAGYTLCEIHTSYIQLALKAIKLVQYKLPLVSRVVLNIFKEKNF
jgi:large subunit ribosomal protein L16